jgi:PAS domain S-box-containing protein
MDVERFNRDDSSAVERDGSSAAARDHAQVEMLEGILSRLNGFVYRCVADDAFTMIYLTDSIRHMLGYPASDFIGNKVRTFVSVTYPEDVDMVGKEVDRCVSARTPWSIDYRLVTARGQPIWINEIGAGIYNDDGNLAFLEGAIMGIDDKKQVELKNQAIIGAVSSMSNDIVTHTGGIFAILGKLKMLAFNARIEAARVGDAGLGFNVVAQEIKALADETQESATAINKLTTNLRKLLSS